MMPFYDIEMMSKEAKADLCVVVSQHLPGDTNGTEETLSQDAGCPSHKFKTDIPE
jgi:hypothetical protein